MWKLQENILNSLDKKLLKDFIESTDRYTQFDKVKEFEAKWSNWQECNYSIFVNSGSSADLIMIDAVKELYNINDFDEVLVPAVTWTTNITSVIQCKLNPIFVDINLNDLSFDYNILEQYITNKTKIILVTHLLGIPANMDKITEIALKYNLIVLEDCCESHGAKIDSKKVGNFGFASTFSFYWGHHLTTIEGGMVCTSNESLRDLLLLKRSHGLARELPENRHLEYKNKFPEIDFNFLFLTFGYNVRNTELSAVLGINQLFALDSYIEKRNTNYKRFLEITSVIKERIYDFHNCGISSFCFPFIFKTEKHKNIFELEFRKHKVEFRPIIGGNLLRQPCFQKYGNYRNYINADIVHNNGLYIGNNQFVNEDKLGLLEKIITKCL